MGLFRKVSYVSCSRVMEFNIGCIAFLFHLRKVKNEFCE